MKSRRLAIRWLTKSSFNIWLAFHCEVHNFTDFAQKLHNVTKTINIYNIALTHYQDGWATWLSKGYTANIRALEIAARLWNDDRLGIRPYCASIDGSNRQLVGYDCVQSYLLEVPHMRMQNISNTWTLTEINAFLCLYFFSLNVTFLYKLLSTSVNHSISWR